MSENVTYIPERYFYPQQVMSLIEASPRLKDWTHTAHRLDLVKPEYVPEGRLWAVLDTGFDSSWLGDVKVVSQWDCTGGRDAEERIWDGNGHGTACASIFAAQTNDLGIIGTAPGTPLYMIRVLYPNGTGSTSDLAKGIRRAVRLGVEGMSISIGFQANDSNVCEAIREAREQNIHVICANGNDGPRYDSVDWPARCNGSIGVGSVGKTMKPSGFASRGPGSLIWWGGEQVLSLLPRNQIGYLSGTSMSAPGYAGLVARLEHQYDTLTPAEQAKFGPLDPLDFIETINQFSLVTGHQSGAIDACEVMVKFRAMLDTVRDDQKFPPDTIRDWSIFYQSSDDAGEETIILKKPKTKPVG